MRPALLRTGRPVLAALLLAGLPSAARAQRAEPARVPPACGYHACAYGIVARAHGLRVVRGADEAPVATLGFLFTRDISGAFDGAGRAEAVRAVRTRRWAALLTDAGLALLATGAVRAAADDADAASSRLMLAGAATLGLSVPLQFRADTHLARAVWQHNARFAGAP